MATNSSVVWNAPSPRSSCSSCSSCSPRSSCSPHNSRSGYTKFLVIIFSAFIRNRHRSLFNSCKYSCPNSCKYTNKSTETVVLTVVDNATIRSV